MTTPATVSTATETAMILAGRKAVAERGFVLDMRISAFQQEVMTRKKVDYECRCFWVFDRGHHFTLAAFALLALACRHARGTLSQHC